MRPQSALRRRHDGVRLAGPDGAPWRVYEPPWWRLDRWWRWWRAPLKGTVELAGQRVRIIPLVVSLHALHTCTVCRAQYRPVVQVFNSFGQCGHRCPGCGYEVLNATQK